MFKSSSANFRSPVTSRAVDLRGRRLHVRTWEVLLHLLRRRSPNSPQSSRYSTWLSSVWTVPARALRTLRRIYGRSSTACRRSCTTGSTPRPQAACPSSGTLHYLHQITVASRARTPVGTVLTASLRAVAPLGPSPTAYSRSARGISCSTSCGTRSLFECGMWHFGSGNEGAKAQKRASDGQCLPRDPFTSLIAYTDHSTDMRRSQATTHVPQLAPTTAHLDAAARETLRSRLRRDRATAERDVQVQFPDGANRRVRLRVWSTRLWHS